QQRFATPVYLQPIYSTPQQFGFYGVLPPPVWPPSSAYFEGPLYIPAQFPSTGFLNGFTSPSPFKPIPAQNHIRHYYTGNRHQGKPHGRASGSERSASEGGTPLATAATSPACDQALPNGGDSSPQPATRYSAAVHGGAGTGVSGSGGGYSRKDAASPRADSNSGEGHAPLPRGRYSKQDERNKQKHSLFYNMFTVHQPSPPAPVIPEPNFDLAPSNFPPLPGASQSIRPDGVFENRMADVVRGIPREKHANNDENSNSTADAREGAESTRSAVPQAVATSPLNSPTVKTVSLSPSPSPSQHPLQVVAAAPAAPAASAASAAPQTCRNQEPKKLSYAEICQRALKDGIVQVPAQP
uniref:Uncharacterized protein n=1 Tax=Petromyzon marinus TaxID=7757 RepID=S4R854_PETMA